MIKICWIFFEISLCIVEFILFHIFLSRFGEKRLQARWQNCAVGLLGAGLIYIKDFIFSSFWASLISCFIILLAYAITTYKLNYYQYIAITSFYFGIIFIVEMLVTFSMQLVLPTDVLTTFMDSQITRFTCAMLSKTFLFALVMITVHKNKEEKEELTKLTTKLLFCAVFISIICLYSLVCFEQLGNYNMTDVQDLCICVLVLGIFMINILAYIVIKSLNDKIKKEKRMEMVQYQNMMLEKTILENKELEMQWRRNRHDFNNHLSCIDMLLQMENISRARAYIQNLTQNFLASAGNIKVGNEIADAILNQKWLLTNKHHITFNVEGMLPEKLAIDQVDICAILSNSLDNAIEAVIKIKEEEKRVIDLYIKTHSQYLVIEVSNTVKEEIDNSLEKLETTKKDQKHHGIGMTSMQMTVEKYNGHLEWNCKDYCFHLVILLPFMAE